MDIDITGEASQDKNVSQIVKLKSDESTMYLFNSSCAFKKRAWALMNFFIFEVILHWKLKKKHDNYILEDTMELLYKQKRHPIV